MTKEILFIYIGVWSSLAIIIPMGFLIAYCFDRRRHEAPLSPKRLKARMNEIARNTRNRTVKKKDIKQKSSRIRGIGIGMGIGNESIHSTLSIETDVSSSANICHICLDEFQPGDIVSSSKRSKDCIHLFHKDCVKAWLIGHDDCPVCRNVFLVPGEKKLGKNKSRAAAAAAAAGAVTTNDEGQEWQPQAQDIESQWQHQGRLSAVRH